MMITFISFFFSIFLHYNPSNSSISTEIAWARLFWQSVSQDVTCTWCFWIVHEPYLIWGPRWKKDKIFFRIFGSWQYVHLSDQHLSTYLPNRDANSQWMGKPFCSFVSSTPSSQWLANQCREGIICPMIPPTTETCKDASGAGKDQLIDWSWS